MRRERYGVIRTALMYRHRGMLAHALGPTSSSMCTVIGQMKARGQKDQRLESLGAEFPPPVV